MGRVDVARGDRLAPVLVEPWETWPYGAGNDTADEKIFEALIPD